MSEQLSLLPSGRFWVVRIGTGDTYGPFGTSRAAERFAAVHGQPTSNFVIPVKSPATRQDFAFRDEAGQ